MAKGEYLLNGQMVSPQAMKDAMQPSFRYEQSRMTRFNNDDDILITYQGVYGAFNGNLVRLAEDCPDPVAWISQNFTEAYGPERAF